PDRIAGRVDDDAGDDGCTPLRGFHRRRHQVAIFLMIERVPLAGRTGRRHAVAAGADQPVDLRCDQFEIDLAIFSEWRGHRGYHGRGAHLYGSAPAFPSTDSGCPPALPAVSAGCASLWDVGTA